PEALLGTAVEAGEPDLGRRLIELELRCRLFRGELDGRRVQCRGVLQTVFGADVRIGPIHHHDAGRKPQQEDHRERDAEPAVNEDQRALEEGKGTQHRGDSRALADEALLKFASESGEMGEADLKVRLYFLTGTSCS